MTDRLAAIRRWDWRGYDYTDLEERALMEEMLQLSFPRLKARPKAAVEMPSVAGLTKLTDLVEREEADAAD